MGALSPGRLWVFLKAKAAVWRKVWKFVIQLLTSWSLIVLVKQTETL